MLRRTMAGLAVIAALGFGNSALADTYAAGSVFGGPAANGGLFVCRIHNAHTTQTVTISQRRIMRDSGTLAIPTFDNCNVPLAPNRSCRFQAPIGSNFSYNCRIITVETSTRLTGVAESQGPGPAFTVLSAVPMLRLP